MRTGSSVRVSTEGSRSSSSVSSSSLGAATLEIFTLLAASSTSMFISEKTEKISSICSGLDSPPGRASLISSMVRNPFSLPVAINCLTTLALSMFSMAWVMAPSAGCFFCDFRESLMVVSCRAVEFPALAAFFSAMLGASRLVLHRGGPCQGRPPRGCLAAAARFRIGRRSMAAPTRNHLTNAKLLVI